MTQHWCLRASWLDCSSALLIGVVWIKRSDQCINVLWSKQEFASTSFAVHAA